MASLQEYDGFGRESKAWLSAIVAGNNRGAFVADFSSKSTATYNNTTYNSAADGKPFTYPVYESSPLNRIQQQYGPGQNWQDNGKSVKTDYLTNSSDYPCAYYSVSGDNLVRNNNYDNGQLYVTRITDEEGNVSYEFKDKLGRVVLQRQMDGTNPHDTYYVYDDFGNLRYVLPPIVADIAISNGTYTETGRSIKNYAYIYKYDERNRCIWKRLPGCEPVYYVYDRADRLIFSQDGEQRTRNEWLFNKYDAFGRIILSGICPDSRTQSQLAEAFKNTLFVEYPGAGDYGYSWNQPLVVGLRDILAIYHYDDYQHLLNQGAYFYNNLNYENKPGYGERHNSGKGLLVGTRFKLSDGSGEVVTAMYYDSRGCLIQKKATNHLGGIEKEYLAYSFTGQIEKREHHSTNTGITENYRYEYDHAERLINTYYQASGQPEYLISHHTYDELGRLKTTTPYLLENFKSTYSYNIRSWTGRINSTPYTEDLTYRYNGNVETMQWLQGGATRKYTFSYDGLSRLKTANYTPTSENFSATYNYDKHGNLTGLTRGSQDILTLNYSSTNQLYNISDSRANSASNSVYEFKDYSTIDYSSIIGREYWYNANGAMTKDLNKGISGITYNTLGQPMRVDIKSPVAEARNEYVYSADGQKLKTVHKWSSSYSTTPVIGSAINTSALNNTKTIDYVGNIIYENGLLKRILTENGYYEGGNYYFYIKNHLGSNIMVVNKNTGGIVQNNHYFPFGLTMGGISTNQGEQAWKYTGKELDMEHGLMLYDYDARQYDPAVGRFTTPDPLAEKYYSVTPYAYCKNNPVNRIDPDGRDDYRLNRDGELELLKQTKADNHTVYAANSKGGTDKKNSVQVDKSFISSKQTETVRAQYSSAADGNNAVTTVSVDTYTSFNTEQATQFFEFAANNTDVEWSQTNVSSGDIEGSLITTSHLDNAEAGQSKL